jgi:hypothetical protein
MATISSPPAQHHDRSLAAAQMLLRSGKDDSVGQRTAACEGGEDDVLAACEGRPDSVRQTHTKTSRAKDCALVVRRNEDTAMSSRASAMLLSFFAR